MTSNDIQEMCGILSDWLREGLEVSVLGNYPEEMHGDMVRLSLYRCEDGENHIDVMAQVATVLRAASKAFDNYLAPFAAIRLGVLEPIGMESTIPPESWLPTDLED